MLAAPVAYNRMLQQGHGAIYNMEGLGSDGRRITGLTPYGTSKRAVRYFTDAFAAEVKNGPVIVGTISPVWCLPTLLESGAEGSGKKQTANQDFITYWPMRLTPWRHGWFGG
jgi:NAD(P)-dependent dehydrogenase (short-subunit alcohol dehydrogenase family)